MFENLLIAFGNLSIPFLISNLLTLSGFFVATFLALRYTQSFYGGRTKPNSWVLIVAGLITISASEVWQFLLPYRISPPPVEGALTLLGYDLGIVWIAVGTYLLYRGVQ